MKQNMKITNGGAFFVGLLIGFIGVGGIFAFFQPRPIIKIPDKMTECIDQGGQFSLRDWSLKEDNSKYKIRCRLPEKELFFIDL